MRICEKRFKENGWIGQKSKNKNGSDIFSIIFATTLKKIKSNHIDKLLSNLPYINPQRYNSINERISLRYYFLILLLRLNRIADSSEICTVKGTMGIDRAACRLVGCYCSCFIPGFGNRSSFRITTPSPALTGARLLGSLVIAGFMWIGSCSTLPILMPASRAGWQSAACGLCMAVIPITYAAAHHP